MGSIQRLNDLAVSESGFIFDPYTGSSYSVNQTGLSILRLLRDGTGREGIVSALGQAFEVGAADLHRDLDEFLHLLRQSGVLPEDFNLP